MINLITIHDNHAQDFQVKASTIESFKGTLRGITGGSVLVISTSFRTDIFYESEKSHLSEICKVWSVYTNRNGDYSFTQQYLGDSDSLTAYFDSISFLSRNTFKYWAYLKAFRKATNMDYQNPLAKKLDECDRQVLSLHEQRGLVSRKVLAIRNELKIPFPSKRVYWKDLKAPLKVFSN